MNNSWSVPKTKSDRNKRCRNLIKVDGTPLMAFEIKGIIDGQIEYFIATDEEIYPYYDEEGEPITDQETLIKIKSGQYKEPYKIALKKCNASYWTAIDRKGYRTVNSMICWRSFGKYFEIKYFRGSHIFNNLAKEKLLLSYVEWVNLALTGTLQEEGSTFYTLYRMF